MWRSVAGVFVLTALAWLAGEDRRAPVWRIVAAGLGLQFALALLFLRFPGTTAVFAAFNDGVLALQRATEAGTSLVFGYLGGAPPPFESRHPGADFVLAFRALPLVIVVSALTALLTHWRILPAIVRAFARALERSLGVGGAVGLSTAANVFVGMVEAPLFIRPYLERLTRSELFVVMNGGMAGIAGTVLVLYAAVLGPQVPGAAGHLLVASFLSAPAAVMVARLMVPERGRPTAADLDLRDGTRSAMDAVTRGTLEGLQLFLNILAMLIAFVALVYLANAMLSLLPAVLGAPLSLQRMLGWLMAPLAWLLGVPWNEAQTAGALLGTKTVLNELLAYLDLAAVPADALSARSRLIMTYALCGFANFGSLGIMIGGLATLAPLRREEIVGLGMKSILGGTLATLITAAVVGTIV
jgi:CNT family concentrative nucleoside transporter